MDIRNILGKLDQLNEGTMAQAKDKPTGPKFGKGKLKGTDPASAAKDKYVGEESILRDLEAKLNEDPVKRDLSKEFKEFKEGATGAKPGWMLRQDPVLAKKVKDSKRGHQALKKWAGKPVPKDVKPGVEEAYDHSAPFNAADFNRHMEQLRAREELRKTDPMKALVGDMIDKDNAARNAKKKPQDDDSMSTSDPRHPQYAYTQAGQQGVAEEQSQPVKYRATVEYGPTAADAHFVTVTANSTEEAEAKVEAWCKKKGVRNPMITINGADRPVDEGEEEALKYATQAHAGQTRSGGDPYITHPMRVADHIRQYKQSHNLDALISAAYLHDTIEDTDTTQEVLHDLFGGLVASLVKELTSDPEQIKKMGKAQYLSHKMAVMSSYALVIKLADRLDNVKDITTARTPQWRAKYAAETNQILDYIEKTRALSNTHKKLISLIRAKLAEIDNPQQGVAEGIVYNTLNIDNQNLIDQKAKSKPDGIYTFRGIMFRVSNGRVTHYAAEGSILVSYGNFNSAVGSYSTRDEAKTKLKSIKEGVAEGSLNEFAPGNGDDGIPHAEYVVYQCDPSDQFEFIGGPLYQTDNLGMAHKYAYEKYVKHRPKAFVIYQPHAEASRGNYGVKGESDSDEDLKEFAVDKDGEGDGRSKLIGSIAQLLQAKKKVDFYVPGIRGHVAGIGGQGDWVTLKRWNKPYSKVNYSLALDSSDDRRFALKMIRPDYYQVVQAGDLDESWVAAVAEGFSELDLAVMEGGHELVKEAPIAPTAPGAAPGTAPAPVAGKPTLGADLTKPAGQQNTQQDQKAQQLAAQKEKQQQATLTKGVNDLKSAGAAVSNPSQVVKAFDKAEDNAGLTPADKNSIASAGTVLAPIIANPQLQGKFKDLVTQASAAQKKEQQQQANQPQPAAGAPVVGQVK